VGAAVPLRDVVGEAEDIFVIAVVPPERHVQLDVLALASDDDGGLDQSGLGLVQVADEGFDAALIVQHLGEGLGLAVVLEPDGDAGIEESELAQAVLQRLSVELNEGEGLGRGHEGDFGAGQELAAFA
jgi:hypothetical protein